MRKKAQEEIVGFIVIILLVAVIFLVFLGITLRKTPSGTADSLEVSQFLESALELTTNCTLNSYSYLSVRELVVECYKGSQCLDSASACNMLENTLKTSTESAWNFNQDSPTKSYSYELKYISPSNQASNINPSFIAPAGPAIQTEQVQKLGFDTTIPTSDGKIIVSLEIYK